MLKEIKRLKYIKELKPYLFRGYNGFEYDDGKFRWFINDKMMEFFGKEGKFKFQKYSSGRGGEQTKVYSLEGWTFIEQWFKPERD